MTPQALESTQTTTVEHNLFGEVRTIGRKVDDLEKATLSGIEILNGKIDEMLKKLASIEARDIRIEQEVSPPGAVRLVLSLGTTVKQ